MTHADRLSRASLVAGPTGAMPSPRWMLARLRGIQEANLHAAWLETDQWRRWSAPSSIVRGESFYQETLVRLTGPPRRNGYLRPVDVTLRREPDNEHDFDAVRVEILGELVGYVAKEFASDLAWLMDGLTCPVCVVAGVIRGGYTRRPNLGVMLWPGQRVGKGPAIPIRSRWRAPGWPPSFTEGSSRSGSRR